MTDDITLTIDERPVTVPEGTTILQAAKSVGINIPTICYHEFCTSNGLCRICVVEVEGSRTLVPACVAKVSQDMVVRTRTPRVVNARRTILEMLNASVDLSEDENIQDLMHEYAADEARFPLAEPRQHAILDDNPMYIRDYAKCILCWRCVQVCADDAQYTYAINFSGRGYHTSISTYYDLPLTETTCVFCGQCVGVCPTGALKPKREWLMELGYTPDQIMQMTRTERKSRMRRPQASA
ncbi:MAG: 2Fe-2S iron-sulfur cluster binding domain-containing protein [Anaerolineae bacterium]|nr:2Fe-2S iron-sulfur cluster binding domain-containing protein [Anaerolineae bacterium]